MILVSRMLLNRLRLSLLLEELFLHYQINLKNRLL
nr:MAG TPA: hypothetical protein [Caudoviricetes sp.]